jgi:hypothetical protein
MIADLADFVALLSAGLADLHNKKAEVMVQGACRDWPGYQKAAGYVEALGDVRKAINVAAKKVADLER